MKFKRGEFTIVPNREARRGLKPAQQVVFMWLSDHSDDNNECYPSRRTLAAECGMSVRGLVNACDELEKMGLITRKSRYNRNTQQTNLYTINILEPSESVTDDPVQTVHPPVQDLHAPVHDVHTELNPSNSNQLTKSTNVDLAEAHGKAEINELFEYWEQTTGIGITSRVLNNRRACYNLLRRHGVDGVRRLIDGVARAQGDRFAPRIASFESLQQKLPELLVWGRQVTKSRAVEVIS